MKILKKKELRQRTLLILTLSVLFISCKSSRNVVPPVPTEVPVQKIEIIREKTVRDTLYSEPVLVQQTIGASRSRLENSWSVSTAQVDTLGVLTHTLENRPMLPGKLITENTHRVDSVPVPYPVPYPVPSPPEIVEVLKRDSIWWIGLGVIIAAVTAVVIFLLKTYFKFIKR